MKTKRQQRINLVLKIRHNLKRPLGTNVDETELTFLTEDIKEVFSDLSKILALDGIHPIKTDGKVEVLQYES